MAAYTSTSSGERHNPHHRRQPQRRHGQLQHDGNVGAFESIENPIDRKRLRE
jgi:hypothetical protein